MIKKGCGCHQQPQIIVEEPTLPEVQFENIPCPDTTQVRIENHPDEEDLTEVLVNEELVLKFKDKVYNPMLYSGYGRIFLRKNMQDSMEECPSKVNVLTQAMFLDENGQARSHTIYIVQYDYDLMGNTIFIPSNSILLFLGGSFKNGTLILNDTLVLPQAIVYEDFIKCIVTGRFKTGQMFYTDDGIKFWNGSEWKMMSASSIEDFNEIIAELQTNVNTLLGDITELRNKDTQLETALAGKAASSHTHTIQNISGLANALENKLETIVVNPGTAGEYTITPQNNTLVISGGGEGSSVPYVLPVATASALGGIKIGYSNPQANEYPVLISNSGTNKNKAYVKVPGYNDSGIIAEIQTIKGNYTTLSSLVIGQNALQGKVQRLETLIGDGQDVDLSGLESDLKLYIDDVTGEAISSLTTTYWALDTHNDQLLERAFSGFESKAGPNGSIATIFADYMSHDEFNNAQVITQANADAAIASIIAQSSSGTKAAIEVIASDATSNIRISADRIDFGDSLTSWAQYITKLFYKEGVAAQEVDHGVYISDSGITVYNGNLNPSNYSLSNVTKSISLNNGALLGLTINYGSNKIISTQLEPERDTFEEVVTLRVASSSTEHVTISNKGLTIRDESDYIKLGFGLNATGTFTTQDGKTVTVENGIITEIAN